MKLKEELLKSKNEQKNIIISFKGKLLLSLEEQEILLKVINEEMVMRFTNMRFVIIFQMIERY